MPKIADSRWRVLPVGRAVTLQRTAVEALLHVVLGLAGLFAVTLASGIIVEEVLAGTEVGAELDRAGRALIVGILVLGALALLLRGLLQSCEGPLMARALSRAMREGTPATEVPHPAQWRIARDSSARAYRVIAIIMLVALGMFFLIAGLVLVTDPDLEGLVVVGAVGVMLALIGAGFPLTGTVLPRWQRGLAEQLPQRWTEPHRIVAAGRALTAEDIAAAQPEALPGRGLRALSSALNAVVAVAVAGWFLVFEIILLLAYPGTTRITPTRQLGERAVLDADGERLVDLLVLAQGLLTAIGVLAFVGSVACAFLLHGQERRALRRAIADPTGPPPPHALLAGAMARTSLPVLALVHALSGAAGAFGAGLWFLGAVVDREGWSYYASSGPLLRALAPSGPWIVLGALVLLALALVIGSVLDGRDRELRDALVQRWPVSP